MVYNFPNIERGRDGLYVIDNKNVQLVSVPVTNEPGGAYPLSKGALKDVFGISTELMDRLPKNLIVPQLRSDLEKVGWQAHRYRVKGAVCVYEPVEWIPVSTAVRHIPKSEVTTVFEREVSTTSTSSLYGAVSTEMSASGSYGIGAFKFEAKVAVEAKIEAKISKESRETMKERGEFGKKALKEVIVGMNLKVREIHRHSIDVILDNRHESDSLTWSGEDSWNDLWIPSRDLEHLVGLQFGDITMEGPGHSSSLCLQVVPEFDSGGNILHTHLALSSRGWRDWYAYLDGKEELLNKEEVIAWPARVPECSFIAVQD